MSSGLAASARTNSILSPRPRYRIAMRALRANGDSGELRRIIGMLDSSTAFKCLRAWRLAVYGAPYALRRCRHFHVAYAKFAERIHDRVYGDGECRRRPTFAGRTNAERMGRGWYFTDAGVEERKHIRSRHCVVHERARQKLPGPGIIKALFDQCLSDTLRDAAMSLTVDDHRVDGTADVIDGGVFHNLERAKFGIDLDL